MGYSRERAVMEHQLAVAHRAINRAKQAADESKDDSAYLDLLQIEVEIVRVAEASLRGRGKRVLAGMDAGVQAP